MNPLTPEEYARAIAKVKADYEAFLQRPAPGAHEDAKAFTAHHAAARSALAHLEHLMKLHPDQKGTALGDETSALMEQVRQSMQATPQEEEGEEDDGE